MIQHPCFTRLYHHPNWRQHVLGHGSDLWLLPIISGSILLIILLLSTLHLIVLPHMDGHSVPATPTLDERVEHTCVVRPFLRPPIDCNDLESLYSRPAARAHNASIVDYGGVGDGVAMNTAAFERAIAHLSTLSGGARLDIPPGRWLTGCFELASHLTLFLHKGAVILASQVSLPLSICLFLFWCCFTYLHHKS